MFSTKILASKYGFRDFKTINGVETRITDSFKFIKYLFLYSDKNKYKLQSRYYGHHESFLSFGEYSYMIPLDIIKTLFRSEQVFEDSMAIIKEAKHMQDDGETISLQKTTSFIESFPHYSKSGDIREFPGEMYLYQYFKWENSNHPILSSLKMTRMELSAMKLTISDTNSFETFIEILRESEYVVEFKTANHYTDIDTLEP